MAALRALAVAAPLASPRAAGASACALRCGARCLSALTPSSAASAIAAFNRPELGSRESRRARQHGLIPGIIYGGGTKEQRVYVSEESIRKELHKQGDTFLSCIVDLTIDGQQMRALPRDLQLHPFRPKILSCNWLVYSPGRYPGVKLDLPLKPVNEERCPAYKEGGWLLELMYKLPVYVHGPSIPPFLPMDLRGKRLGDKVMASEVNLGLGVQLRWRGDHDFAVAKLVGSKRGMDEEGAAGAPAGAAGAGDKAAPGGAGAAKAGDKAAPGGGAGGAAKPAAAAAGGDKK